MNASVFMSLIALMCYHYVDGHNLKTDENEAAQLLLEVNAREQLRINRGATAEWNYHVDMTDQNMETKVEVEAAIAIEQIEDWRRISEFQWQDFRDYDLRRQFKQYSILGMAVLPAEELKHNNKIITDMQTIMQLTTICDFNNPNNCDLSLEPDIIELMSHSRNEPELKDAWLQFHDAIGSKIVDYFPEYVNLQNEIATLNNFTDMGDFWLYSYEAPDIKHQIFTLWEALKPLYHQLHAYVRTQLRQIYGPEVVSERGPIPAHLLGDMYAQNWGNIAKDTLPFPYEEKVDITEEMLRQGYTVQKMFNIAEDFFMSINMSAMTDSFWKNSVLEKATDRLMSCQATSWDFATGEDYRISMCPSIDLYHLNVIHHEMGHLEYCEQYKHLPVLYRIGANEGFHEAVGDAIAISVSTTKHQHKIGLRQNEDNNYESQINQLYELALNKVGFLPFGLMIDLWRWEVFEGKTHPHTYNCRWWELKQEYQGVEPPVDRSDADFDPAAKFHVVANVPYLRYFVAYVLQFQFHRSLCEIAGQYVPGDPQRTLHECDIYESVAAGNALKEMLAMGLSRPWMDALETLTGNRYMDASGMLDYFLPLQEWLEKRNQEDGAYIGWEESVKYGSDCIKS